MSPDVVHLNTHFQGQFGRLRAVRVGPDGHFYIATSNRDGRTADGPKPDRIYRVDPRRFMDPKWR